jgi:O-antigen ligase
MIRFRSAMPLSFRLQHPWFWSAFGLLPLALPLYLVRFRIGPLPSTALEIALLSVFAAAAALFGLRIWKDGWQSLGAFRLPAVLWIVATAIAIFAAPDLRTAFGLWRAYVLEPILLLPILCAGLAQDAQLRKRLATAATVLLLGLFAWAAVGFALNIGIPAPWNTASPLARRATGPFPFPNALALIAAPFAAWLFAEGVRQRKSLFIAGAIAGLGSAILAKSVGGSLAIGGAAFLFCLSYRPWRKAAIAIATAGILVIAAIPTLRAKTIKTLTFDEWSGRVRVWMWQDTWRMLKDRPLLGAGFGGYPTAFRPYQSKPFIEIFQYPHQIALTLWSETGIFGLLAFAVLCGTWIVVAGKDPERRPLLFALVAILIHGLVDVPYFKNDLAVQFWILAGLAAVPKSRS